MTDDSVADFGTFPIYMLIAVLIVSVIVIGMLFTFNKYSSGTKHVPEDLIGKSKALRFLYSPVCFIDVDEAGVAQIGLIDKSRFTSDRLNQCFPNRLDTYNFQLVFTDLQTDEETRIGTQNFKNNVATSYFFPVRIKDGTTIHPAKLVIHVQKPFRVTGGAR